MRPSLLPGLIAAARRNLDRGASSVRLFEIGRRYLGDARASDARPAARRRTASRAAGSRGKARAFDAFDAKAEVAGAARSGRARRSPTCRSSPMPGRPGTRAARRRSASARRRSSPRFGELHPSLHKEPRCARRAPSRPKSISTRSRRRARAGRARAAYAPPALQPVTRDFAFIVPAGLAADNLLRAIRGADKAAITDVRLFDRFEAADGLSLAFEVTLQPAEKSFTDEQIGEISQAHRRRRRKARRAPAELDSSALIAAWTRASISSRLRPGGIGFADLEGDGARRVEPARGPTAARCPPRPERPAGRARDRAPQSPTAAAASRRPRPASLPGRSSPAGRSRSPPCLRRPAPAAPWRRRVRSTGMTP